MIYRLIELNSIQTVVDDNRSWSRTIPSDGWNREILWQ